MIEQKRLSRSDSAGAIEQETVWLLALAAMKTAAKQTKPSVGLCVSTDSSMLCSQR